jgi:hypothetical protein
MGRPIGRGALIRRPGRIHLRVERLEDRSNPAGVVIGSDVFYPTVVAGDPIGIPPDSPDNRIDPNSKTSPYAGVGSVQVTSRIGSSVGTGSVIGRRYVLTAAHVLDGNNDGVVNSADRNTGTYFILNFGGNRTHRIAVTKITVHPDYDGFGNSLNDDIAILKLARNVPAGVPIYDLPDGEITQGMVVTMVGYGRSGDGINGYNTSASYTVKRVGSNTADAFYGQDDAGRPEANEVFRFDFDGPNGEGPMGGETLGNDVETTIGAGDSGGPAFAGTEGGVSLYGMATFVQGSNAPLFGSMGGGVNLFWYLPFINSVLHPGTGGGLILPGEPSLGLGGPHRDAIPVSGEVSDLASGSAASPGRPIQVIFVAAPDDEDNGFAVASNTKELESTPTPPADLLPVAYELIVGSSLLSIDAGLLEFATGGVALTSDE